jgi:hypothetical protein
MRAYNLAGIFISRLDQRTKALGWLITVCAVALALYFISPFDSNVYAPCPFNALTNLHCPGCGTLRGLHELLHGRIGNALSLNLLMVITLPFIAFRFIKYVAAGIRKRPEQEIFIPSGVIWAFLGIVLLFWLLRNLPYYPFTLLAP